MCQSLCPQAQFKQWTTVADDQIIKFTSKDSQILPQKPVILVTTYSMLSFTGKRNETVRRIIEQIRNREWGLMILDEVHVAPAK
jgi:DNA excision repair protein ERCC-3